MIKHACWMSLFLLNRNFYNVEWQLGSGMIQPAMPYREGTGTVSLVAAQDSVQTLHEEFQQRWRYMFPVSYYLLVLAWNVK